MTKQLQAAVSYQWNANGAEQCSYCSMFEKPCHCSDVAGVISATGWCQLYRPKTNPHESRPSVRLRGK